ncbi:MAG: DUF4956 domain-containing protein [Planctomycetota bacterium]
MLCQQDPLTEAVAEPSAALPEWFSLAEWGDISGRLLGAALLGAAVAGLYVYYRPPEERTRGFAQALILLAPLITMVTMAVGGNVAAAFTLVGTLAIVRFRTAVRDTRDTVYVIFAVAVGMAMGQLSIAVAVLGTLVLGLVILLMRRLRPGPAVPAAQLRLMISPPDGDPAIYKRVLDRFGGHAQVVRSSIDEGGTQLSLRLAVQGIDPVRSPEVVIALLAEPDIQGAMFAADDE